MQYISTKNKINELKVTNSEYYNILKDDITGYTSALYSTMRKSGDKYYVDYSELKKMINAFLKNAKTTDLYNSVYIGMFSESINESLSTRIQMMRNQSNQIQLMIDAVTFDFTHILKKNKLDNLSKAMEVLRNEALNLLENI